MEHFADRLQAAIEKKGGPVCVGIDPVYERLPAAVTDGHPADFEGRLWASTEFVLDVMNAVAEHVPCVKLQSACFERYGWRGVKNFELAIEAAYKRGLLVIADVKRGDIGTSAAHYAAATLAQPSPERAADAVTINSYLGRDGIEPFVKAAAEHGKGVFALVRTSNPGGDALQTLRLAEGQGVSGTVAEAVGGMVAEIGEGEGCVGACGYSLLGAVVGATKPTDAASLRERMPRQWFLVPGFGAQGGSAEDVKACFDADGRGALVTASRSITYAFEKEGVEAGASWMDAVERAAVEMKRQVNAILGR